MQAFQNQSHGFGKLRDIFQEHACRWGRTLWTHPYTVGEGLQGLSRCELIGEALPKHFLEFRDGALVFRDQYIVEPLTFQDCL